MKALIKVFFNAFKLAKEQNKIQATLNTLIGQKKKSDYIKISLPKKYIAMVEVLAAYGIKDSIQLLEILKKHYE